MTKSIKTRFCPGCTRPFILGEREPHDPAHQRTFTEAEVSEIADSLLLGYEEGTPNSSAWQRIGTTALRAGQRLRIVGREGEELTGSVVDVTEDSSHILFDDQEEPSIVDASRLTQGWEYVIERRVPGGIIAGTASVSVAALFVALRSRSK